MLPAHPTGLRGTLQPDRKEREQQSRLLTTLLLAGRSRVSEPTEGNLGDHSMPRGLKDGQSTTGSAWQGIGALADRETATYYVRFGKWEDPELVQGLAQDLSITLGPGPSVSWKRLVLLLCKNP